MARYDKNFLISMTGYLDGNNNDPIKDPGKSKSSPQEEYYQSSAKLAYYKDILNGKLKAKNPEGFKGFFKDLMPLRLNGKHDDANAYIQNAPWDDYLSNQEVRSTLGEDYDDYVKSLKAVNSYNVAQGQQNLYGNIEGLNDVENLNYGRRFASLMLTPTMTVYNKDRNTTYKREYTYNPQTKKVEFSDTGDTNLKPSYLSQ